ncbi:MAG TPA: hypothetical protein VIG30_04265 [Ktedonobacterales bacterium]|jgi:hypothetical protein
MSQRFKNERTGAEVFLGRSGTGFYVETTHPAFQLPLRKTYEWYQEDLATRDFELLCAVVGAVKPRRRSA